MFALRSSTWAAHPEVQVVMAEYEHFENAKKTPTKERRVSLQIFYASRAIDSLLEHIVQHEQGKTGRAVSMYVTLEKALREIHKHSVGGQQFQLLTALDLKKVTDDRNNYMHNAGAFPSDGIVKRFLTRTYRVIGEAVTWPV